MTTRKKTYFPQRTFDDDLEALSQLAASAGWNFTGVDFAQLAKDATEQRTERAQHDAEQLAFSHTRETFGIAQEARHRRFSAALNAARGAFRNDKAVLAQLNRFKRSMRRSATTKSSAA